MFSEAPRDTMYASAHNVSPILPPIHTNSLLDEFEQPGDAYPDQAPARSLLFIPFHLCHDLCHPLLPHMPLHPPTPKALTSHL